jgi:hypothetical protein
MVAHRGQQFFYRKTEKLTYLQFFQYELPLALSADSAHWELGWIHIGNLYKYGRALLPILSYVEGNPTPSQ